MRNTLSFLNESTKYAAYAASRGFSIQGDHTDTPMFVQGVPVNPLVFVKKDVRVFLTDRGWRVAYTMADGRYRPSVDADFYSKLYPALVIADTAASIGE